MDDEIKKEEEIDEENIIDIGVSHYL